MDFGYAGKVRYVLVVSKADPNCRLAITTVVKVTEQYAGTPYEVTLPRVPWLREQSYCNVQSIQPVEWREFQAKVGHFDARVLKDVRTGVATWLGL